MENKTLETLQRTKARLEACLEVDTKLSVYIRADIKDIVELIDRILDEVTTSQDAE